jgi:hypothetical protein
VVVEGLPFHVECKAVEALNIWSALEQARRDCPEKKEPAVFFKRNRTGWYAALDARVFLTLLIHSDFCGKDAFDDRNLYQTPDVGDRDGGPVVDVPGQLGQIKGTLGII